MDWILLGFLLFFCAIGIYKGFVKAVFSLVSTFLIAIVAWKACPYVSEWLAKLVGNAINSNLSNILNNLVPGTFSDVSQLQSQISQEHFVFALILSKILTNISFEGNLSAGQILSPTLTDLILKVLSFVIVFVVLLVVVKILRVLTDKLINLLGLAGTNRLLGGAVGLCKGLLFFIIFYMILCAFANFTLNENLLNFISNGVISKNLYNWFVEKIINLFY